jgi:hypothetical protein
MTGKTKGLNAAVDYLNYEQNDQLHLHSVCLGVEAMPVPSQIAND